jgi:hypothetical protein
MRDILSVMCVYHEMYDKRPFHWVFKHKTEFYLSQQNIVKPCYLPIECFYSEKRAKFVVDIVGVKFFFYPKNYLNKQYN